MHSRALGAVVLGALVACGGARARPGGAPTCVRLTHENALDAAHYELVALRVSLDGAVVFDGPPSLEIHRARLAPGEHRLALEAETRMHGLGIFRHLDGQVARGRADEPLEVREGAQTDAAIVTYESGEGAPEDRVHVRVRAVRAEAACPDDGA